VSQIGKIIKRFLPPTLILGIIVWTLCVNATKTDIFVAKHEIYSAEREIFFQNRPEGRNVTVGDLLIASYQDKKNVLVAPLLWKKHKIIPIFLGLFSYPHLIKSKTYNAILKKENFDLLATVTGLQKKADINGRNFYLLFSNDSDIGIYCYEFNIVIASTKLVDSLRKKR
jgi:hypothetical protein